MNRFFRNSPLDWANSAKDYFIYERIEEITISLTVFFLLKSYKILSK